MNKTSEEKLNEWKKLIEEKKQSKLLLKDFCKERNITPARFYYYHGLINRPKKIALEKNTEIAQIKIINSNLQEAAAIRFILPNKLECFLPHSMPLSEIKALLEALMPCY